MKPPTMNPKAAAYLAFLADYERRVGRVLRDGLGGISQAQIEQAIADPHSSPLMKKIKANLDKASRTCGYKDCDELLAAAELEARQLSLEILGETI